MFGFFELTFMSLNGWSECKSDQWNCDRSSSERMWLPNCKKNGRLVVSTETQKVNRHTYTDLVGKDLNIRNINQSLISCIVQLRCHHLRYCTRHQKFKTNNKSRSHSFASNPSITILLSAYTTLLTLVKEMVINSM